MRNVRNNKRSRPKQKFYIPILMIISIWVSLPMINGAYAVLISSGEADNIIYTPVLSAEILESDDGVYYDGWTDLGSNWGVATPKYTKFTNAGQSYIVIRASYSEFWSKTVSGTTTYMNNLYYDGSIYAPLAVPNWSTHSFSNPDYWYDGGDGWYYYRYLMAPGDMTDILLSSVSFADSPPAEYTGAEYQLFFSLEAVQYSNNPDNENQLAVWNLFGKTYTESGGYLTWSDTAP